MKYLVSLTALVILMLACSEKLTEQEYNSRAKKTYSKQNIDSTLINYKAMIKYYPQGEYHAEALFMLGFINANDLKNFDEAKKYYIEFTTKYPDHELADDAQYEIETLGKDINELPIFQNAIADSAKETQAN